MVAISIFKMPIKGLLKRFFAGRFACEMPFAATVRNYS